MAEKCPLLRPVNSVDHETDINIFRKYLLIANYGSQGRKKEINKKSTYILSIISNASSSGNAGAIWGTPISLNG